MIKPMLFSTDMVRAILEDRKTVTRRVVKPQPDGRPVPMTKDSCWPGYFAIQGTEKVVRLPYQPGDILWVRETWAEMPYGFVYRADGEEPDGWDSDDRWSPSIHMPRKAARLFLRVTSVRVEPLQDITEEGALAEGVPDEWPMDPVYCPYCKGEGLAGAIHPVSLGYMEIDCPRCAKARDRFANLWDSTIKPKDRATYGWTSNPWVWVIEFERCDRPEGFV